MRQSLYARLLRQQSTPKRSNQENFLTEGLCDLLNRLSGIQQGKLLARLLPEAALPQLSAKAAIQWETQQSVRVEGGGSSKRPDLIGYLDGTPAFLVEVKVSAGFTAGRMENDARETIPARQLEMYGQWLHKANPEGHLVLLSWRSRPPETFSEVAQSHGYGTRNRHTIAWQQVYEALALFPAVPLAAEYRIFLQEEGIAMDAPSRRDFALLELFLDGASGRIRGLMRGLREELRKKHPLGVEWGKGEKDQAAGYAESAANHCIQSWAVLSNTQGAITWGIHFPQGEDIEWRWQTEYPPGQLSKPVVFVFFCSSDPAEGTRMLACRPASDIWMHPASGKVTEKEGNSVMAVTPLEGILDRPDPAGTMFEWVDKRFQELLDAAARLNATGAPE